MSKKQKKEEVAMEKNNSLSTVETFFHSQLMRRLIVILVVVNAAVLGLNTDAAMVSTHGPLLILIDHGIIYLLTIEILLRFLNAKMDFFKNNWNVFNTIVILISLYAVINDVKVLDAVRLLLLMRVIELLPSLDGLKVSLGKVLKNITGSVVFLIVVLSAFSIAATHLFGHAVPDKFVNMGTSMATMLQVMTFVHLDGIIHSVQSVSAFSWLFFGAFRILTLFAMLNILVSLVMNAICDAKCHKNMVCHDQCDDTKDQNKK